MIIRTIQMLLEYIGLILSMHKVAKKKVKLNLGLFLPFIIEWIYALWSRTDEMPIACKLVVFGGIFIYVKIELVGTWKKAINVFGIGLFVLMSLQFVQIFLFKIVGIELFIVQYEGIIINVNICVATLVWKEEYSNILIVGLNKVKAMAVFLLIIIRVVYLFSQNTYADFERAIQFLAETLGLSVACILWISAEKEKNHKSRELQMYEMYNKAFEEAIITIRTRQHEFDNHINAIRCMKYTIDDYEEMILAQDQYCEKVLHENKLNKLLKLKVEPVLLGFLYYKITSAEEKGIVTKYEIQSIDIKEKIAIYEFIELAGILFDNAVEALEEKECKQIVINLKRENEKIVSFEVANVSSIYSNSEIEKFCSYGYSTKGEGRGVGLSRVKEIAQKYNAVYHIQNCIYNSNNYLSFKLSFK